MDSNDMITDQAIRLQIHRVQKNEHQIKTRQQGILHPNVLHRGLEGVIPPINGVGGGQDGAAGVEPGVDTGFGDGDTALFHDLVDGRPVHVRHLVELVDTDDPAVGQDHGAGLQSAFTRVLICRDGGRQTHAGSTATRCGYRSIGSREDVP